MKDKDGFNIRCIYSDWKIVDQFDNHDFVCTRYFEGGTHYCFCDEYCRDYTPDVKGEEDEDSNSQGNGSEGDNDPEDVRHNS